LNFPNQKNQKFKGFFSDTLPPSALERTLQASGKGHAIARSIGSSPIYSVPAS
jgi:hypothetical protein